MLIKGHKIILLLPAKTASNSFKDVILSAGKIFADYNPNIHIPKNHLIISELCKEYEIDKESLAGFKIVQIVRNPFDRFVSAYEHQKILLPSIGSFDEVVLRLQKYKHYLPSDYDKFYESFYGGISYKYYSFSRGNWGGIRLYYDQSSWNDLGASVNYFKLEDVRCDMSPVARCLGFGIGEMKVKNKGKKSIDPCAYYTERTRKIIAELYADDLRKFDYSFEGSLANASQQPLVR